MGLRIVGPLTSGVTAGGAGTSTNNATSDAAITGLLVGIYITFNDSPPAATADTTIQAVPVGGGVTRTLLTITNGATTGYYPVRVASVDTANAANGMYDLLPLVNDKIKITLAQANDGDSVTAYAYILD